MFVGASGDGACKHIVFDVSSVPFACSVIATYAYPLSRHMFWLANTISFFKKLSELGFTGKDATSSDWDNGYIKLREYFHMNGHSYVPPGTLFGKDEFPLGTWVTYQRSLLRKGKLSSVKFIKLNRLHFLWNVDLGQLLLSSNSDDPLVRQTKLNLKNTLINLKKP